MTSTPTETTVTKRWVTPFSTYTHISQFTPLHIYVTDLFHKVTSCAFPAPTHCFVSVLLKDSVFISLRFQIVYTAVSRPVTLPIAKESQQRVRKDKKKEIDFSFWNTWWLCYLPYNNIVQNIVWILFLSTQKLHPDPILRLNKIIGFGGATMKCVSFKVAMCLFTLWDVFSHGGLTSGAAV